jgi:hypothetical protein
MRQEEILKDNNFKRYCTHGAGKFERYYTHLA